MLETAVTLLASTTVAASGAGDAVELVDDNDFITGTSLDLELLVEDLTGTLTVTVQTSADGLTGWTAVTPKDSAGEDYGFAPSVEGVQARTFADLKRFVRVSYALTGVGATATIAVAGTAFVEYATPADLARLGLRGEWLTARGTAEIVAVLRAKTDILDGAISVYSPALVLPYTRWGYDLREGCALLASGDILITHGVDQEKEDDPIFERIARADRWLGLLAEGRRRPAGAVDRTPPG